MIKINKQSEPDILKNNKEQWKRKLLSGDAAAHKLYNHPDIKAALKEECKHKCMYCESRVSHVSYEHIEHIKPKIKFPELTFEWLNLGLACPVCNKNKDDYYDANLSLVNPYQDNPSDHFFFIGPMVYHKPGDLKGEVTEKKLKLNRHDLTDRRIERINSVRELIDRYINISDNNIKTVLKEQIYEEIKEDKEYSANVKSLVQSILDVNDVE